jgi:ribosomal subunit interface protein
LKIAFHRANRTLSPHVRAYAEYRVFSATGQFENACARSSVHLEERHESPKGRRYRCDVVVNLATAERLRVRATRDGLYGAIDSAAERLARRLRSLLRARTFATIPTSEQSNRRPA